jgi:hypothetical protein
LQTENTLRHRHITRSQKAQHTHTHRNKQKTTCTGYDTGGDRPPGRSWLKAFCPNVGIPSFVLSGMKRAAAAALAMAAAICTRKRENRVCEGVLKTKKARCWEMAGKGENSSKQQLPSSTGSAQGRRKSYARYRLLVIGTRVGRNLTFCHEAASRCRMRP